MKVVTEFVNFSTKGDADIIDITPYVEEKLESAEMKDGIVNVSVIGSTGAITTCEYEPGLVKDIKNIYDDKNQAVVHLHGKPGSGKSAMGFLLAKQMNGTVCKTFNPTEPGFDIEQLYAHVNPTKQLPLILIFDEVDVILEKIHHNKIEIHKSIPIPVKDKQGWNSFMDDIAFKMYPYLILVMTSNKSADYVDQMDSSYLRLGRVDNKYKLEKN